ncbi:MAG TPA: HAD family hydrolase [Anaerolineales bacterium]|nr:HAD family hydrolase [Anaerolineales bacterium]
MKENIKAILFDFDGTLRHNDPVAHNFFFDHAVHLGASDSPENRRDGLRWAHLYWNSRGGLIVDTEKYGYDSPDFWLNYARHYLRAFNCPDDQADDLAPELTRHMAERYEPVDRIDEDTPAFLESLRSRGYVLAIVSNRTSPYHELVDSLGLAGYFDFIMAAGDVKSWKPEPEIFHHALERAGTRADETVYVGDNYFADIVGSRGAGLHPVLFDPEGVFPDADCAVIETLPDLHALLNGDGRGQRPR